jgi:sulfate/thiosulfate transport system substrate-binding protein
MRLAAENADAGITYASFMVMALVFVLTLCGGCSDLSERVSPEEDRLTLGAFSVTREVFHDGLIPAFQKRWQSTTGRKLIFEESYLASGALSRAIGGGFDADVALFSLDPDLEPLVNEGLVASDWNTGPHRGHVVRSLVVIGYRPGNPKQIRTWNDLTKPDVDVVYADPKTSGGARWNLLAVAAAGYWPDGQVPESITPDMTKASGLLKGVQSRVKVMDGSGRQSLATFLRQIGDAVVTYENDLVQCQRLTGQAMPYVIPERTIWIEMPAVEVVGITRKNGRSEIAQAFLAFLRSQDADPIWAEYGFRPYRGTGDVQGLPKVPSGVVTVDQMGGWQQARKDVFGENGLWTRNFLQKNDLGKEGGQ